jgi:hypothetical protein
MGGDAGAAWVFRAREAATEKANEALTGQDAGANSKTVPGFH